MREQPISKALCGDLLNSVEATRQPILLARWLVFSLSFDSLMRTNLAFYPSMIGSGTTPMPLPQNPGMSAQKRRTPLDEAKKNRKKTMTFRLTPLVAR